MQRSGRLATGEPRLIIGELSGILREYLGARYRILALDMTSTELLAALAHVDLRQVTLDEMKQFADESDLLKFAGVAGTPEELAQLHAFVRSVVERTMQTREELERLRSAEIARLARQKRLRIQVMAPAPLRLRAFVVDALLGAIGVALAAWLAIDTQRQGLFDAAFALGVVWLAVRDWAGGGSPGKALVGLQIAAFDGDNARAPTPGDRLPTGDEDLESDAGTARMAAWTARLQRNLLMLIPGGGVVAEDPTGCGCRAAGSTGTSGAGLWVLLGASIALRRRRFRA